MINKILFKLQIISLSGAGLTTVFTRKQLPIWKSLSIFQNKKDAKVQIVQSLLWKIFSNQKLYSLIIIIPWLSFYASKSILTYRWQKWERPWTTCPPGTSCRSTGTTARSAPWQTGASMLHREYLSTLHNNNNPLCNVRT